MFSIALSWKSFKLNLNTINTWMKANAGTTYLGITCDDDNLYLWFPGSVDSDVVTAIQTYWDGLDESSTEATSYQTKDQIKAAADAAKAALMTSAQSKLEALGLTADEIAAIVGA